MTDVCSGAGMVPKPGVDTSIVVTPAYIQSLLPPILQPLYPFLPYIQAITIGDVTSFCAGGPPTWEDASASDFLDLVSGGLIGQAVVAQKFIESVVKAYLWYSLCKCNDGSTPDTTTPPTLPDLPAINPPNVVTPPLATACATYVSDVLPIDAPGEGRSCLLGCGDPTQGVEYLPMPVGATRLDWQVEQLPNGADHANQQARIVVRKVDGTFRSAFPVVASGATATGTITVAATDTGWYIDTAPETVAPTTDNVRATATWYCAAGPGQTVSPCCPPDEIATGLLSQILDMVTLIQRQAVPFAFIDGAEHTGLTGTGHIDVQGLLGARLTVTAIPDRVGRLGSDPEFLYDLGSISWGSSAGHSPREVIHTSPQLSFPRAAAQYTRITYSLLPDVVVTLRELVREP